MITAPTGRQHICQIVFALTPQDQIWATTANGNVVFLDDDKNEFIALDIKNLDKNHPIDDMTAIWASPLDNILLIGTKAMLKTRR